MRCTTKKIFIYNTIFAKINIIYRAKADFYEYLEVVTDALDKTRPDCSATLNDALK